MFRRIVITGAVLAFPLGAGTVVATSVTPSGASVPFITANGSVTCTTLKGAVHYNPPLFYSGTSNTETMTLKVKLNSFSATCSTTATNLPPGGILYGSATSSRTTTSTNNSANACAALAEAFPLKWTIVWHYKSSAGVTLAKLTPTTVPFFDFATLTNDLQELGFDLPSDAGPHPQATATGSFAGLPSDANVFATKTATSLVTKCATATSPGLKAMPLGGPGTPSYPSHLIAGGYIPTP